MTGWQPSPALRIALPPGGADPARCLAPTDLIASDAPEIVALATELTRDAHTPHDQARCLFVYVRDRDAYDFAPILRSRASWRAVDTIARGKGFCQMKAVLLASLLRAVGVPSAIGLQHLRDDVLVRPHFEAFLPGGVIPFHGLTWVYLDGAWMPCDATLDKALCERRGYRTVAFDPGVAGSGLLPTTRLDGARHFDVMMSFGPWEDLPHEVTTLFVRLAPRWEALAETVRRTGATM